MTERSDAIGIGIDETHEIDAELLTPLEQLARERHGRLAGAHDQQALRRPDAQREPLERQPPAGDERRRRIPRP